MEPTSFTPVASALGGALIGLAAVMMMAVTGRVAVVGDSALTAHTPRAEHVSAILPGFASVGWFGLVPEGTPDDIVAEIDKAVVGGA